MSRDIEARVRRANLITRDEQLEQLFGDDVSHRLLRDIRMRREGRMTEITSEKQSTHAPGEAPPGPESIDRPGRRFARRGVVVGTAAFAAVIAVGIGLWVGLSGGRDVASAASLLSAFTTAWDEQDVEGAAALFTEDAEFDPGPGSEFALVRGQAEIRALFAQAMPILRISEAYELEADGGVVKFKTRLIDRVSGEQECQRNEMTLKEGKIGSWRVTVISTYPCP